MTLGAFIRPWMAPKTKDAKTTSARLPSARVIFGFAEPRAVESTPLDSRALTVSVALISIASRASHGALAARRARRLCLSNDVSQYCEDFFLDVEVLGRFRLLLRNAPTTITMTIHRRVSIVPLRALTTHPPSPRVG